MNDYLPKGLKELDDGNLEANLAGHYTAEGQQYFATEEGSSELTQFVQHVKTHRVKPRAN